MSYTVDVEHKPGKFLRSLKDAGLLQRLRRAIDSLADSPRPSGCVKLSGSADLYRLRVGDYRIIYQIRDAVLVVLVVEIGHRRDVYR
jgi:mRNA interferase RelE/StbE